MDLLFTLITFICTITIPLVLVILLLLLPFFIAKKRQTEDISIIILLSSLGIITAGITWIVALCMACFKQSNTNKIKKNN